MGAMSVLVPVFGVFIPALLLPGPDFVAVVRSSLTRGTRAGLLTTIGVSTGLGFYATLSLLGLSAVLVQYQWLTWVVRVLGGGYLIYLGIKLLRAKPAPVEADVACGPMRGSALVFGFLVTLTNPKAIVLFASVFATAVTASTPGWLMVLMIGLVVASSLTWYSIVSLFMSSAPVMRRFQHARHWIERVAGVSFVLIGGRIIADARNPVTP
ncbi:Threonine/homoserine/homoserine lactone efflux protein [Enhydrobacter aerosaccus]|uniref:Threonine/homoserine/homoserine lactone efflux protein n=1 Tax=Enhydrobacter aerosaccus TaxID=225324 RepID=A0A1T4NQD9_9HYPH|nr:LysE family translocator [Enhydrobacter aerosaccus]SJZ81412.1 Threonine/homoserine/homoserine lactone efflux protein [Enhydrobacter aerosaccus]